MEERHAVIGSAVLVVAILVVVASWVRVSNQEVEFCRRTFGDLVHGRQAAQRAIDWEHLKAMGTDVGVVYQALRADKVKEKYRQTFIKGFSEGFRRIQGAMSAFTHWRVYKREATTTVVAVDDTHHKKTLLFTIPASGKRQLEEIQWDTPTTK